MKKIDEQLTFCARDIFEWSVSNFNKGQKVDRKSFAYIKKQYIENLKFKIAMAETLSLEEFEEYVFSEEVSKRT